MKVPERSMEPVSVMDRCDYPATRKKESLGMEREITQPENEELGALEWLMGIEEAYAEEKKSAGNDSDRAMSKLHDNCFYLHIVLGTECNWFFSESNIR